VNDSKLAGWKNLIDDLRKHAKAAREQARNLREMAKGALSDDPLGPFPGLAEKLDKHADGIDEWANEQDALANDLDGILRRVRRSA